MSDRPRLVVVGSVNVDLVVHVRRLPQPGETVTGGVFSRQMGGKGANQAVAAARLGAATSFVGAVGNDDLGAEALAALAAEGIDISGCVTIDAASTGVAIIAVDAAGENQIAVASGANLALDSEAAAAALGRLADQPAALLTNLEISDSAVLAAARQAHRLRARIVLNPAPARRLPAELLALHPLLVPNEAEAGALAGGAAPDDAAARLSALSSAPVIVTLGQRGALLLEPGGKPDRLPAPLVRVVDATGAGDTFAGALATELAAGREVAAAARFAVAAAALSVTRPGARAGMPTRDQVEELLQQGGR